MRDFYAVTKVRSSIYDGNYQKILSYPDEHTPICSIMHGRADTLAHCKYSNLRAFKQCEKEKGTIHCIYLSSRSLRSRCSFMG